jgi:MIP family channel proteins
MRCISEFVGTYLLVLVGPASVVALPQAHVGGLTALCVVAMTFGGTVAVIIDLLGTYSGAIINPALTLASLSARLLGGRLSVLYVISQFLGGLLAGLTLSVIFSSAHDLTSLGSTKLATGIDPALGIALEAGGTFVLALSALIATTRLKKSRYQALLVGGTLAILILLIGPFTGAGFNPARSLGPALAAGYLSNLPVYFVGPFAGALIAGLLFRART